MAAQAETTKYSLGSVLNHVLMHQTIVGNEALLQMEMADDYPDILVGCTGGGSNFSGLANPFLGKNFREGKKTRVIACEPKSCPTLTEGKYVYDFGDTGKLTPLVKMHTLGSQFIPPATHSGGLRYHGMAPLVSHLKEINAIEAKAYGQKECFEAGVKFANAEGIVPAPEATHAVKGAIDAALECKEKGESKTILFNLFKFSNIFRSALAWSLQGPTVCYFILSNIKQPCTKRRRKPFMQTRCIIVTIKIFHSKIKMSKSMSTINNNWYVVFSCHSHNFFNGQYLTGNIDHVAH